MVDVRRLIVAIATAAMLAAACSPGGRVTGGQPREVVGSSQSSAHPRTTPAARTPTTEATTGSARPTPDACARNVLAQRVIVDISAQHAWLCARTHTVYQSAVTTGAVALAYDSTPVGTFHVQSRSRDVALTLIDGSVYRVHYWVPFDAPLFGFHDAGWQTIPFGSPAYRTRGSHGCVHMPLAAMSFLYRWAVVGTAVTIRA